MKAVVLAGGSGTRMRPIAYSMAKQLIPVANKPILFYGLEDIAASGVEEAIVVVNPQTGAEIRDAVGSGEGFGLNVTYVVQEEALGIAHALNATRAVVGDDDVLLYLGDNLLRDGVGDTVAAFEAARPSCHILLSRVPNPQRFGVVTLDETGQVVDLTEKPERPRSDLALVGVYLFDSSVWEAIDRLRLSSRGEYEITEAIQLLLDSGRPVAATEVSGWWKDTGEKEDLLDANDLVLAGMRPANRGSITDSDVAGALVIGNGSSVTNCRIEGPVMIGDSVTAVDSFLGPGTSIGDQCTIVGADVQRSIVLEGSTVERWRLRSSLLGRAVTMTGRGPAEPVSVTLGERSQVAGT